jgi:hypothetical protein
MRKCVYRVNHPITGTIGDPHVVITKNIEKLLHNIGTGTCQSKSTNGAYTAENLVYC